jgi:hypothetical protein
MFDKKSNILLYKYYLGKEINLKLYFGFFYGIDCERCTKER